MTESHFRIAFLDDLEDLTDGEEYNRDGHGEDQSAVELDGHGTSSELETLAQTCLDCINCNVLARYTTRKQCTYNCSYSNLVKLKQVKLRFSKK